MASKMSQVETIPSMLKHWSQIDSEKPAFVFADKESSKTFTRHQIYELAGKMASKLRNIGLKKGDVVSIIMKDRANCPDWLIAEYGIQMAGCVSLDALGDLKSGDDTIIPLQISKSRAIIVEPTFQLFHDIMNDFISKSIPTYYGAEVVCPKLPYLKYFFHTNNSSGKDLESQLLQENGLFFENIQPDDVATLLTTSGTTSIRKLVARTHRSIMTCAVQLFGALKSEQFYNDRSFGWLAGFPMFYVKTGCTRILQNKSKTDVKAHFELIVREKCTSAILTPALVHDIYKKLKSKNAPELMLDSILLGGQPLRRSTIEEAKAFAKTIFITYASTEALAVSMMTLNKDDEFEDYCAGYVLPELDVKLVDENGDIATVGEKGEILLKGPGIFKGYLTSDGTINKDSISLDGWFQTGDIGYIDSERKLFVEGRGSDVIMHDCTLVFPHHIEDIIRQCPLVEDVIVVALPDELMHHVMCACIKPIQTETPLHKFEKIVSDLFIELPNQLCYQKPEHILLFESFPCNRNGKIIRKKVAVVAKERLVI